MNMLKTPPFNSTEDLVKAVREKRKETGLTPPVCLIRVCWERKLNLSAQEKHVILSKIAHLSALSRESKERHRQISPIQGLFPGMTI